MQGVIEPKAWIVTMQSGNMFELSSRDGKRLALRYKGSRAGATWTIESGPGIGTVIGIGHIESVAPKRSVQEEKNVIKLQAAEERAKRVRVANVQNNITSQKNKGNEAIASCDVLHTIQNVTGADGEHQYVVDTKHIVPRVECNDQDVKRFFPICKKCGWRGTLIKASVVEKIWGITPDEVVPYEG
jgi:hypothetical protein